MSADPVETLVNVYGAASVSELAAAMGVSGDAVEGLNERFGSEAKRRAIVEALPEPSRELLAFMDGIGRRLRGERLKKRWFLHGYVGFVERLEPLIAEGVVIVGNVQAREPVALDAALEQGVLQQWLQVTPGFTKLAGDAPPPREVVEQVEEETTVDLSRRLLVLEFNVLNAARWITGNRVRLNRDGSPHRSDLKGLAPLVVDRPQGRADTTPDPNDVSGYDLLLFVLSIANALGFVERHGDELRATGEGDGWFRQSLEERLTALSRAVEQQVAWSELEAIVWHTTGEPPVTGQGAGGFREDGSGPGTPLQGPRGSVLSALRRLAPNDWFDLEVTLTTITQLESRYLASALPIASGDEASIEAFVRGVVTLTLTHVGAIELGTGSSGKRRARLTDLGRALLGIGDTPTEATGRGAILVEPNFEVTCFLDLASLRLLFDLSRFAELTRTSERVVRYRLHGESVQWGYARGYTADGIARILGKFSAQPVPPAVTFALQDWERLHRRVTVFLAGDLVAATGRTEPEVLQSGLEFAIEGDESVEVIDDVHTFVIAGHTDSLDRSLNAHSPRTIDYSGAVVPSLYWMDEERLRAPVGATDIRLLARLQQVCDREDEETLRLAPDRVRSQWGDPAGYERLIEVLRSGLVGGLSAEREILLKRLLGRPADARVEDMEVLVVSSAEDGDRLARISAVSEFIAERLGPKAFHVVPGCTARLTELLRSLGISVERRTS